jgi:probable rRNA maturation factor
MSFIIDIQHACEGSLPFNDDSLNRWAKLTLEEHKESAELTLRLVEIEEITDLNHCYRSKNAPTNVLAFPASYPQNLTLEHPFLGDVILCPAVLKKESLELQQGLEAHWAHIVIHGILHLLGYDHIKELDTSRMQAMEIKLLAKLNFASPYGEVKSIE